MRLLQRVVGGRPAAGVHRSARLRDRQPRQPRQPAVPPAAPPPPRRCRAHAADARPARVELSAQARAFVAVEPGSIALTHVRVIDGTGAPAREDQNVLIGADGRIAAIGPAASTPPPAGARRHRPRRP